MARPREFDRDEALESAVLAFAEHGYEGTSTDALLTAMRISRQSLYDTFGDKRRLYLEALQRYTADSIAEQIRILNSTASPRGGIEAVLLAFIARSSANCLGVNAICEFGAADSEVTLLTETAGRSMRVALERRIADGKATGEIAGGVEPRAAAEFILATLSGLKVAARAGTGAETLRGIVHMAMRSLV